jgi:hypothetical protein
MAAGTNRSDNDDDLQHRQQVCRRFNREHLDEPLRMRVQKGDEHLLDLTERMQRVFATWLADQVRDRLTIGTRTPMPVRAAKANAPMKAIVKASCGCQKVDLPANPYFRLVI